jgi:hypothetical protein
VLVKNPALIGIYQPRKADGTPDGDPIEGFYPRIDGITDEDFWRAQWGPDNKGPRGRKTKGLANLLAEVCHCGQCGAGLIYMNTGKGAFLTCGKARRGLCDNRYLRTYHTLEAELLSALALFDFSRLLDRADPQVERIAGLEAEIAAKTATVDRLLEDFSGNTPVAVSKRIGILTADVEGLTIALAEAKRTARIAEAHEARDAYAEFREMIESLPAMPDDDSRYQLRAKIAAELRRLIESGTAEGTALTIVFRGSPFCRIGLLINRSTLDAVRVTPIGSDYSLLWPRQKLLQNRDMAGLFAEYVKQENGRDQVVRSYNHDARDRNLLTDISSPMLGWVSATLSAK